MKTIIVGTNTLLNMAFLMFKRGIITQQQYNIMLERNKGLSKFKREDQKVEVQQ